MLAMLFISTVAISQSVQDVIYLNNGSIYKGTIIEEVPGESYKIESRDGNVYSINASEIEKLTREKLNNYDSNYNNMWGFRRWRSDTTTYKRKEKGFFFEGQLLIENRQGGGRLIKGYRFNRYAQLGIGIGVDFLKRSPFNERINDLDQEALAATYPNVFLYFQSEAPFGKRVRPFFALEGGYTMAFSGFDEATFDDFGNVLQGGPMAGGGIGFKILPMRKMPHLSVLFNVNYKQIGYQRIEETVDANGFVTSLSTIDEIGHIIVPGIRLGIGF
jgi:hypothetical protein